MRYYVYISDAKLEMIYEQVPVSARETIASELNINFGIVQAKFRSETVENARHQKILMVENYLSDRISSIEDAKPYSYGVAEAAWGPFGDYQNIVYFGGFNRLTHFGLMGSMSNCIGVKNADPTGYSLTGYIVYTLAKRRLLPPRTPTGFCARVPAQELNSKALEGVVMANQCSINPVQKIEFLSRTVISRESSEENPYGVYIGSPIYVALYDGGT